MALRSAVDKLIPSRPEASVRLSTPRTAAILSAAFLTLVVAGPWLAGGYLFGTDWPGPRHIGFPSEISSSYLLQAALAAASLLIGGEATGKVFILGVLFVAAVTAFEAVPVQGFVARAAGATVYVVNPFVYGRLHYGQLFLLAGFAILPWVATRLRQLLNNPRLDSGLIAAGGFTLLGIFSPHLFLIAAALAAVMVVVYVVWAEDRHTYLKRAGPALLLVAGVSLTASSYWIVPILTGRGYEGAVLTGAGTADMNAYAAVPDQTLGLLPNLLGLYGFWAENTGRFTSMKALVAYWPAVLGLLLVVMVIGAVATLRQRRSPLSPWVVGLLIAGTIGLILEMGVSQPLTAGIVRWLDANFSPYRGMRDAGKWAALLALVYSQLVALGTVAILGWLSRRLHDRHRAEWVGSVAAGLLLALPLYFGNGLLFGMHGEIKPSQYPVGWYAADQMLAADAHPGRALFLPWHEYMALSFVRNQNSVVASPAPTFFSIPVVVSADPGLPGVAPPRTLDQTLVTGLVQNGSNGQWAGLLASIDVKYVLVAREADWRSFRYLDGQPNLVKVADFGSIVLYRNRLVTPYVADALAIPLFGQQLLFDRPLS